MRCPGCGYDPETNSELHEILGRHGYDGAFLKMSFGPEQEGKQLLCPVCGSIVERENPDDYGFMVTYDMDEVDMTEENPTVGKMIHPPYLKPGGEPQTCATCGDLLQSSDKKYIEPREDGPFFLCSEECYDEWHEDYYGNSST